MDLVDEEDHLFLLEELVDHLLDPFLEVAAELRSGEQGTHVQGVDRVVPKKRRDLALDDPLGEALGDGRFSDAGIPDVYGVVLEPAAENLDGSLDLAFPSDDRLELAVPGRLIEIAGEPLQVGFFLRRALCAFLSLGFGVFFLVVVIPGRFLTLWSVGYHFEKGEALDPGLPHVVGAVVPLLVEEGDQDVADFHLGFLGGLGLEHGAVDHVLEADGLLRLRFLHARNLLVEEILHPVFELADVGPAGLEDGVRFVERDRGVQDVLGRQIFMPASYRFLERVENDGIDGSPYFHVSP